MPKVLVITPIKHIEGLYEKLSSFAEIKYLPEATEAEVKELVCDFDAIFTNPNKSNVFLGSNVLSPKGDLKVICTASTGTTHIDKEFAHQAKLKILALTEEREFINKISSTAEHAFALTLSALRNIPSSWESVRNGYWDYEPFVGRQFDHLSVGVIGFGRLGRYYCKYSKAFGARVLVYDPYKKVDNEDIEQINSVDRLLEQSDIISLHVHVTSETHGMINSSWFKKMKTDVLLVNTARGDIVNETDLIGFLRANPNASYATDVLAEEVSLKKDHPLIKFAKESNQVLITPHIGGMTREGQMIAYHRAADMLVDFLINYKTK